MKVVIVQIGDEVQAMYINGKLRYEGDYYHDKIEVWIEGYLEALSDYTDGFEICYKHITNYETVVKYCEQGKPLPKTLTKLEKYFDA